MSDRDTITLPREVVVQLLKMLEMVEPYADQLTDYSSTAAEWPLNLLPEKVSEAITALRTALAAEPTKPITVPKTVPLPPITCGFVDVRFDGQRWFCDKCGKRMSADFEASVRRGSGEKCYFELMQRKAEAVRTISKENKT